MKSVLSISPFSGIYPPMNGGMHRCLNILHQLNRNFDVTAIVLQDLGSFKEAIKEYPELTRCKIVSTKDFRHKPDLFSLLPSKLENSLRYRYWNKSFKGPADSNYLAIYPVLEDIIRRKKFDFVVFEDMFIVNLSKVIRKYNPHAIFIYDAYNVNSKIAALELSKGLMTQKQYNWIENLETNLSRWVDAVFACSYDDLNELTKMNKDQMQGAVVPNGTRILNEFSLNRNSRASKKNAVIFCGSMDYLPNQEGLIWFCKSIWPLVLKKSKDARFIIVGKGDPGNELTSLFQDTSIEFFGKVENVSEFYARASVAIIPLLSGSGTRLKLLEAMSQKIPCVSTTIGAEGIDYISGKHLLIADSPEIFAKSIIQLLTDGTFAELVAEEAFHFVEQHFDWNVIGEKLRTSLEDFSLTLNSSNAN